MAHFKLEGGAGVGGWVRQMAADTHCVGDSNGGGVMRGDWGGAESRAAGGCWSLGGKLLLLLLLGQVENWMKFFALPLFGIFYCAGVK